MRVVASLVLAAIVVLGAPRPVAAAQPEAPRADSVAAAEVDSSRIVEVGGKTKPALTVRSLPPAPRGFDQPRWVMLRSLVVPGWGQLHNRAWFKAAGVAGSEGYLAWRMIDDQHQLDRLQQEADDALAAGDLQRYNDAAHAYNDRLDAGTARRWLFGGLVAYALLDAYIDAHFQHFDVEFKHDPALDGGGDGTGGRLLLRWDF